VGGTAARCGLGCRLQLRRLLDAEMRIEQGCYGVVRRKRVLVLASGQPRHDPRITVVLHECDYGVAELAEVVGLAAITPTVVSNLLSPPLAIPLRFDVAARAAVPETAVHENGDSVIGEQEVGLAGEVSRPRRMPDAQLSCD